MRGATVALAVLLLPGCAGLGSLVGQALGLTALQQASALAPLQPPPGEYVARSGAERPGGGAPPVEVSFDQKGLTAITALDTAGGAELVRARLVPAEASPCSAGWVADHVTLDGQRRWDRPLSFSGSRQLALHFDVPRELLRAPLAMDLSVSEGGTRRCLRLPVVEAAGAGPPLYVRKSRASGGGNLGLLVNEGALGVTRSTNVVAGGSAGAWFGRTRLGGRLDICMPNCSRSVIAFPVTATIDQLLYAGGRLTVGMDVGYQVGRIEDLVSLWGDSRTWVHGPRVGLMLLGPRPLGSTDPTQGFAARGIRLFLSAQVPSVYPSPEMGAVTGSVGPEVKWGWLFGLEAVAL